MHRFNSCTTPCSFVMIMIPVFADHLHHTVTVRESERSEQELIEKRSDEEILPTAGCLQLVLVLFPLAKPVL